MGRIELGWIVVAALGVATGCGGSMDVDAGTGDGGAIDAGARDASGDAPSVDAGSDAGGPVGTAHIVASVGGTVTSDDGLFTLIVPPGALAADTDIGVRTVPVAERPVEAAATMSGVYELTPDGLAFLVPATAEYSFVTPPPGSVTADGVGLFVEKALGSGAVSDSPATTSTRRVDGSLLVDAETPHLSYHWLEAPVGMGQTVSANMPTGDQAVSALPFTSFGWALNPAGVALGHAVNTSFVAFTDQPISISGVPQDPFIVPVTYPGGGVSTEYVGVRAYRHEHTAGTTISSTGTLSPPVPAWICADEGTSTITACAYFYGGATDTRACFQSQVRCVLGATPVDVPCTSLPSMQHDASDDPLGMYDPALWVDLHPFCSVSTTDPSTGTPPFEFAAILGQDDSDLNFVAAYTGPYRMYASSAPVDRSFGRSSVPPGTPLSVVVREIATGTLSAIQATGNGPDWEITFVGPATGPLPHEPGKLPCGEPASFTVGTPSGPDTAYVDVCHDGAGSYGICTLQLDSACSGQLIELGIAADGLGYARRGLGHAITSHSAGTGTNYVAGIPLAADTTFVIDSTTTIVTRFAAAGVDVLSVSPI